jgi:hypothetical protein
VNIPRHTWLEVGASSFGLAPEEASDVIERLVSLLADAEALVERSLLPNAEWKLKFRRFLQKRTRQLAGP